MLAIGAAANDAAAEEPSHGARVAPASAVVTEEATDTRMPASPPPPSGHCRARMLLDCVGLDTVQSLDTIGELAPAEEEIAAPVPEHAVEAETPAPDHPTEGEGAPTLRDLVESAPDAETYMEPAAGPPSTEDQLNALREAIDAAGHGDRLQASMDETGDELMIVFPAR